MPASRSHDDQLVNSNSSDKSPFKSHPIYKLRRCLIYNAVVGVILAGLALITVHSYLVWVWALAMICLTFSGTFALIDLSLWAAGNKSKTDGTLRCHDCHTRLQIVDDPERSSHTASFEPNTTTPLLHHDAQAVNIQTLKDEPQWPRKWILILDFMFGLVLLWLWMSGIASVEDYGYYYGPSFSALRAYATIPLMAGAILHFKSWWAALMARKKASWERQNNRIPPGLSNPQPQSLLPIVEPYQDQPDIPRNASSGMAINQQQACRHDSTQAKQPRKSFSPLAWLGTNRNQKIHDDAARNAALEENRKLLATLTPSATGSTSASSNTAQAQFQEEEDDDETDDQYTSATLGAHTGRASNRSMLVSASDILDDHEGSDTPIAAGMEHAAVVVKKKTKKPGQVGIAGGNKKGKRRQIEIQDEA